MISRRDFLKTGGAGLAGAALLGVAGCGSQSGAQGGGSGKERADIQLSVADPESSSAGVTARHYADQVEVKTGGQVTVKVFPDGALFGGDQRAAVDQLGEGSLDAAILSTSVYAAFDPRMNAVSLPYLFSDTSQFDRYLRGKPGQELLSSLDELEIKGLALMSRTFRQVTNSVRPVEEPEGLRGLKIRVPDNPLWMEFFKEVGADPTPLENSEVYTALRNGTIDGQENPVDVPVTYDLYEVQSYLSKTNHMADGYVLGISQSLWRSLSPETRQALSGAAEETAEFKVTYDIGQEQQQLNFLLREGMKLNELSEEGLAEFRRIAKDLYPQFRDEIGKKFMDTTLGFVEKS